MTPSENCIDLIKRFEGYSDKAYPDPGTGASPWTIGYGHTRGVEPGMTCTMEQATRWVYDDVEDAARAVQDYVRVPLTQSQFDALVSFVYNVGVHNFNTSTLLKKINMGDMDGAAAEFLRWNRAGGKVMNGLTRRRQAESDLFMEA
jgi:lysozyme